MFLFPWRAEKSGGCADGVVVRVLGVWELNLSVRLLFVTDHGEHEGAMVWLTRSTPPLVHGW